MLAGPVSARVKAQATHGRQEAQSWPAATTTRLEAELIGMEKEGSGTRDSTGFSPQICRIFSSGTIPENEGNIRYLSEKIR